MRGQLLRVAFEQAVYERLDLTRDVGLARDQRMVEQAAILPLGAHRLSLHQPPEQGLDGGVAPLPPRLYGLDEPRRRERSMPPESGEHLALSLGDVDGRRHGSDAQHLPVDARLHRPVGDHRDGAGQEAQTDHQKGFGDARRQHLRRYLNWDAGHGEGHVQPGIAGA